MQLTPSCLLMYSISLEPVSLIDRPLMEYCLPFMHKQHMWSPRDIRMTGNREDTDLARIRIIRNFSVKVVEVVSPDILNVSRVDPAVAIRAVLDEHHRREIVDIPASGDFNETSLFASDERFHPSLGFLCVIDLRPGVASA